MQPTNPHRIYVFDFDQTITRIHTGGCAETEAEIGEEYIRSILKDGFVELVEYLVRNGNRTYIATYGDDSFGHGIKEASAGHALVKRYMDVAFGTDQEYFYYAQEPTGNIIARYSLDGKRHHLEQILAREGIDGNDSDVMRNLLLIDDDADNVHYFAQRGCSILVADSPRESAARATEDGIFHNILAQLRDKQ